ncbi:hypothetical protein [Bradyrhizobium sp. ORS 285]|uniref:hypothetical protein n=1 Tax=Bradyrhizobium sp. ORS 285 TaxID=115808 RepID=UPI0002F05523|nr:hypothetical protein [Bradyrhizobium sp. ORS 285]
MNLDLTPEGVWRRAAVVNDWQRDTAWFSVLKDEWPHRKAALEQWLSDANFDRGGRQIRPLDMSTE